MFELIVVEVTRSERHDEVAQADQRRVRVGKQAHHHVVAEYLHGRLLSFLRTKHSVVKFSQDNLLTWHAVKSVKAQSHWPIPRLITIPNTLNQTIYISVHTQLEYRSPYWIRYQLVWMSLEMFLHELYMLMRNRWKHKYRYRSTGKSIETCKIIPKY